MKGKTCDVCGKETKKIIGGYTAIDHMGREYCRECYAFATSDIDTAIANLDHADPSIRLIAMEEIRRRLESLPTDKKESDGLKTIIFENFVTISELAHKDPDHDVKQAAEKVWVQVLKWKVTEGHADAVKPLRDKIELDALLDIIRAAGDR